MVVPGRARGGTALADVHEVAHAEAALRSLVTASLVPTGGDLPKDSEAVLPFRDPAGGRFGNE